MQSGSKKAHTKLKKFADPAREVRAVDENPSTPQIPAQT